MNRWWHFKPWFCTVQISKAVKTAIGFDWQKHTIASKT